MYDFFSSLLPTAGRMNISLLCAVHGAQSMCDRNMALRPLVHLVNIPSTSPVPHAMQQRQTVPALEDRTEMHNIMNQNCLKCKGMCYREH